MEESVNYLEGAIKQFQYYKTLGERAMLQVSEEGLYYQHNNESNSIATIVNHLWGNMMSRFTNFLTEDGEKKWRQREKEFDVSTESREKLEEKWNQGWECVMNALGQLTEADLSKEVFIRNMGHTVLEAINRQLAHYSYHIGQIVYLSRMLVGHNWKSLSIPRGGSEAYNAEKFSQTAGKRHFTDEFLKE